MTYRRHQKVGQTKAMIRRLADSAADGAISKEHVIGNFSAFVNRYLYEHGLDIGYASAREVTSNRKGH